MWDLERAGLLVKIGRTRHLHTDPFGAFSPHLWRKVLFIELDELLNVIIKIYLVLF